MKNYVIGVLGVMILVLSSIVYKYEFSPIYRFPVSEEMKDTNAEMPFLLYLFFSKKDCYNCLGVVEVLNNLPSHFKVVGMVPKHELIDEQEFRQITGAVFPLNGAEKYRKYIPSYTPTLIGVSSSGDIMLVLPGIPGDKSYLKRILNTLHQKMYSIYMREKSLGKIP